MNFLTPPPPSRTLRSLCFLDNCYCNQTMEVYGNNHWTTNDALSNLLNVSNGVKQGGILSLLCFSVYLDDYWLSLVSIKLSPV